MKLLRYYSYTLQSALEWRVTVTMSSRSLNRVQLIGNLTRDPELRYTPAGTAVCTFGLATNRTWTTDSGEKKEEADFHRIVSWNKLAELCSQLLVKGRKVYVEGRIQTRNWQGQDNVQRSTTEIVIDDMIILDSKRTEGTVPYEAAPAPVSAPAAPVSPPVDDSVEPVTPQEVTQQEEEKIEEETKEKKKEKKTEKKVNEEVPASVSDVVDPNDIPF